MGGLPVREFKLFLKNGKNIFDEEKRYGWKFKLFSILKRKFHIAKMCANNFDPIYTIHSNVNSPSLV